VVRFGCRMCTLPRVELHSYKQPCLLKYLCARRLRASSGCPIGPRMPVYQWGGGSFIQKWSLPLSYRCPSETTKLLALLGSFTLTTTMTTVGLMTSTLMNIILFASY
jgi:hypothetical protein